MEEFNIYFKKMLAVHSKCGENCIHLRRFYEKIGILESKDVFNRILLDIHK